MCKLTDRSSLFILIGFYFLAHGGILFIPNAVYWDDWYLYRADSSVIYDLFRQAGSMFNLFGRLHVAMLTVGIWPYRVLTFILMLASGLVLNSIIKRHAEIKLETRFLIVLLFLVLPFNIARATAICFPYAVCYFLFFLAWFLMDRFRVLALALFFLSFNVNSLLVFYAVPVLDMLYRKGYLFNLKALLGFGIRHLDYILLPFLFFFIKIFFFSPTGLWAGYNQGYTMKALICMPFFQLFTLHDMTVNVVAVIFFSVFSYFFIKRSLLVAGDNDLSPWNMLTLGLVVFILGGIPYWILGNVPTFLDFDSRNQLLFPLGSALVIVAITSFRGFSGRAVFISTVLGVSLAFNLSKYSELFMDWQKQAQLIRLFAASEDVKNAGLVVIEDKTQGLNAFNREYPHWEINGLLEAAFGNQKHFGINRADYCKYLKGEYDRFFVKIRKAGSHRKENALPQVLVEIDLIEPKKLREKIMSSVSPGLSLSISAINNNKLP
jgi:hypothetical protein